MMSDSQIHSLHRISELPLDKDGEIFRHYPGFKLGLTRGVDYYAQLMLPLVKEVIANHSDQSGWIMTAPPITAKTPAAANLLCQALFELCKQEPDFGFKDLSLIALQHESEATWADWKDPAKPQDYARLEFADRVAEHERLSRQLPRNNNLRGHPVLFINDIRVTGAQEQSARLYFEVVEAAAVDWLYVIVVEPELGKSEPTLEWQINFMPFNELLRMVSSEEIQFTGKCLQRLMSLK